MQVADDEAHVLGRHLVSPVKAELVHVSDDAEAGLDRSGLEQGQVEAAQVVSALLHGRAGVALPALRCVEVGTDILELAHHLRRGCDGRPLEPAESEVRNALRATAAGAWDGMARKSGEARFWTKGAVRPVTPQFEEEGLEEAGLGLGFGQPPRDWPKLRAWRAVRRHSANHGRGPPPDQNGYAERIRQERQKSYGHTSPSYVMAGFAATNIGDVAGARSRADRGSCAGRAGCCQPCACVITRTIAAIAWTMADRASGSGLVGASR